MLPYYTKLNRNTTLCTLCTPFVTVPRNLYAHAQNCLRMPKVPNTEAEISNILKFPLDAQGNGWFATDSQVCKRT